MAVALITGTLAFVVIISSTVYSRWLRSRGRRVSGAITANVAMGWVLVSVRGPDPSAVLAKPCRLLLDRLRAPARQAEDRLRLVVAR